MYMCRGYAPERGKVKRHVTTPFPRTCTGCICIPFISIDAARNLSRRWAKKKGEGRRKGSQKHLHMNQLTRHDQSIRANKGTPRGSHSLLAICRQRDVARACVPSVQRPLRLTVPDDEAAWCRHGWNISSEVLNCEL